MADIYGELSGNPSSLHPTSVAAQLKELAELFDRAEVKQALEAVLPALCGCCVQSLFADASVMRAADRPHRETEI